MASVAAHDEPRQIAEGQLADVDSHGRPVAHVDTSVGLVKTEEIVCIVPRHQGGYDVFSVQEGAEAQPQSFRLTCQSAAALPGVLLDDLLVSQVPDHLRGDASRQVHLVVSTRSGTGHALDFYNTVLQPLLGRFGLSTGTTLTLSVTRDARSIQTFAQGLAGDKDHTIILMSGDGGIVELLNGNAPAAGSTPNSKKPLVAPLPLGTGNALFNSLHTPFYSSCGSSTPTPLALGLRTLLRGQTVPLPSFRVDFSPGSRQISTCHLAEDSGGHPGAVSRLYGAIVASYGFHSQLVWESDTPEYRKHGDKRFGMVAAELLKECHAYDASVRLRIAGRPGQQLLERRQHAYILATMVSNLERTFTISPASRPLDGQLRLVHFGAVDGPKTMDIMMQAYDGGKHVDMRWTGPDGRAEQRVGYEEIDEVHVTTHEEDARWRKVCIDGTIVELPPGGWMAVRSGDAPHLKILVDRSLCSS